MSTPEKWTGLEDPGISDKLFKLKMFLEKSIKGQPKAINAVCKIYEYDLTLRWLEDRPGPIGVFMFLGPSGVGKTELARMLARYFMGSVDSLVKIDCSAFSQPHMIHSLIGAPHGYIGYDSQPPLSQQGILKRFKKTDFKKSTREQELLNIHKEVITNGIKSLRTQMSKLEDDLKVRVEFIKALNEYHHVLYGSIGDEKSVAELLKEPVTKKVMFSMLHQEAQTILENDIKNPFEDAAILLGLSAEIKQIIYAHSKAEFELGKLKAELYEINSKRIPIEDGSENQNQEKDPESRLVILFDEIEKANVTLHQLLLQIMEDGQLTLANGSVTDLKNAFIILTSNVGSRAIGDILKKKGIGFKPSKSKGEEPSNDETFEEVEKRVLAIAEREMEKTFRPEFRRRIDEVVVFRPLSKKTFYEILDYHIETFSQALNIMEIDLIVEQEAKDIIVQESLHRPEVGASLLDHKFKSLVKIPLGKRLFGKKDIKGTVRVSAGNNGKINFFINEE